MKLVEGDPEAVGWVDILDHNNDLDGIGIGALVSLECDVYIPDVVRPFSRAGAGELMDMLNVMDAIAPVAEDLGLDVGGIPNKGPERCREAVRLYGDVSPRRRR
jgi:hypothetical protein